MLKTSTWNSDPQHTSADFSVRHMMVSTVKGRFRNVSVSYEGDAEDLTKGTAGVEIEVDSVETFDGKRDAHLKSDDFFNAEKFPKLHFRSSKISKKNDEEFIVTGNLTIRDITREVTLDVEYSGKLTDPWGFQRMGLTARGEIVREDFGLKWNTALDTGGVLVGSKVKFEVNAELVRKNVE